MEEIDWSNAPEGAQYYEPPYQLGVHGAFLKTVDFGSGWKWWNGSVWQCHLGMTDKRRSMLIERPTATEWTGTGLPPVGVVCEMRHANWGDRGWEKVLVLYLSSEYAITSDGKSGEQHWYSRNVEFRPIKTAEQIAAEEREAAIDAMAALSPLLDKGWSKRVCAALYDAGYRKTEGTNQ